MQCPWAHAAHTRCDTCLNVGRCRSRPGDRVWVRRWIWDALRIPAGSQGRWHWEGTGVDKECAIKLATLAGDWRFMPGETVCNEVGHAHHQYPTQERGQWRYRYGHILELLTEGRVGLFISGHFTPLSVWLLHLGVGKRSQAEREMQVLTSSRRRGIHAGQWQWLLVELLPSNGLSCLNNMGVCSKLSAQRALLSDGWE